MRLLEPAGHRRALLGQLLWFLLWLGITAFGVFLSADPAGHGTHQQLGLPPCPTVLLFNRPCPGCGLTTSWTATMHGQLGLAFRAHPLGPIAYLLFTASAWVSIWAYANVRRVRTESRALNWLVGTFAIFFLVFGIVRMAVTTGYSTARERASLVIAPK